MLLGLLPLLPLLQTSSGYQHPQQQQHPYSYNQHQYPHNSQYYQQQQQNHQQLLQQQQQQQREALQQQQQRENQVKAFQTQYPSHSQPQVSHGNYPAYQPPAPQQQNCDIPPDLWCDSPQAAQQCGVTRQCDALKQRRPPLKISLIFEALCPYCQKFIANQLGTIFNQFRGQFELELVPWGNARILRDGSFSCNHGQKECDANRLMSCVIDVLKVKGALPFLVCFERTLSHHSVEGSLQQCSAFIRSQYRQIRQCYDGERGIQLQRAAAQKTMSTRPHPIVEVPYLLINDYTPNVDNNNLNIMLLPQLLNKWTKMYGKS